MQMTCLWIRILVASSKIIILDRVVVVLVVVAVDGIGEKGVDV